MTRSGRAFSVAVFSSVALTALLWWSSSANGLFTGTSSSIAVLSFPRNSDDREIVAALREEGIADIVSESTQWISINDFGEWERVPLDTFRDRIETFDPRDDGYAELIRSIFLSADKRFIYVRRTPSLFRFSGERGFSLKVARALGNRSYKLEISPSDSASPIPFILVLLSYTFVFFLMKSSSPFAAFVPSLALAGFGVGGLAAAGFLCAAAFMFVRSFGEWARLGELKWTRLRTGPWISDSLIPGVLFSAAALTVAILGGVPFILAPLSILSVVTTSIAFASGSILSSRRLGHSRFSPVALRTTARAGFSALSVAILPFALSAAIFALAEFASAGSVFRSASVAAIAPNMEFSLNDYKAHIERQLAFLTTRVMDSSVEKQYTLFSIGPDGFASVAEQSVKGMQLPRSDLPPAERFLSDWSAAASRTAFGGFRIVFVLIIAFAVSYPALRSFGLKRRRLKSAADVSDKRIAA